MTEDLAGFLETFDRNQAAMKPETLIAFNAMLISLRKYVEIVSGDAVRQRKGDELKILLDAAFSVSIALFAGIDSGLDGFDDKIADELRELKTRYLGS